MGVRNCGELGINLQKIVSRLMANQDLVKLLYYTDNDPLSGKDLSEDEKQNNIFNKLIRIIPNVGEKDTSNSIIVVFIARSEQNSNKEFNNIVINIDVYTPLTQWIIKDSNLRPFATMGKIEESLNHKTVNGLGKIQCGDFDLILLTEDISCYRMPISITTYD